MSTSLTETSSFVFRPEELERLARENRRAYAEAQPFPHIVIDDFLPEEVLRGVLAEFPRPGEIDWVVYDNPAEKQKLMNNAEAAMGPNTRLLLYQFNSATFLNFLEALTGIEGIIPDPHFWGGGLHQTRRGGFLKIHADFNRHYRLKVDRRLNLLLYLNRDWREEYGGALELWDREMKTCHERIQPVFNRCVIFSTTDFSYHGHPDPVLCPEGETRKSLALYYYTNGRPAEEVSGGHSTLFRKRAGEEFEVRPEGVPLSSRLGALRPVVRKLAPPILFDVRDYLRRKLNS